VLPPQFPSHLVECFPEMAPDRPRFVRRHLHIEIAGGDLVGGADQTTDRSDELIGESEAIQTAEISNVSESITNTLAKPSSIFRLWPSKLAKATVTLSASRATFSAIGSIARPA